MEVAQYPFIHSMAPCIHALCLYCNFVESSQHCKAMQWLFSSKLFNSYDKIFFLLLFHEFAALITHEGYVQGRVTDKQETRGYRPTVLSRTGEYGLKDFFLTFGLDHHKSTDSRTKPLE